MADIKPRSQHNLDGYDSPLIEWQRVEQCLGEQLPQAPETGGPNRHTAWLATTYPNGRPHVMPLGIIWDDSKVWFSKGPGTRSVRNLNRSPYGTITIATHPFDLVIEGLIRRVTDQATLERLAGLFGEQGWRPTVQDGAFHHEFSAPSAGPPPWHLYELTPTKIFALGAAEPYGATRYDF